MSYVTLITERYDDVVEFYGGLLGFPVVDRWDRPNARGLRFDLGGMRLEIIDNQREKSPLALGAPVDRVHVVVEVDDIEEARDGIKIDAPPPQGKSWGARLFQLRDPDGVPVTFLQWTDTKDQSSEKIRGRLTSGVGQGKHFTHIDWARRQFIEKLHIDPFPGTVNLIVDGPESMSVWDRIKDTQGVRIDNPNDGPNDCNARCYPVSIEGRLDAAIVLPEVANYSANQIELIAPVSVRDALGVDDGDSLILEVKSA
jgi:catechol 2,3-dioxygenase-like lactoylglutathione lyase family enzyme